MALDLVSNHEAPAEMRLDRVPSPHPARLARPTIATWVDAGTRSCGPAPDPSSKRNPRPVRGDRAMCVGQLLSLGHRPTGAHDPDAGPWKCFNTLSWRRDGASALAADRLLN